MKLNAGCGNTILDGFINLDFIDSKGVNVVHDLNKFPYPFKDNTFSKIVCRHTLEHLEDVKKVIVEFHRILKPDGILQIYVPHFSYVANCFHRWYFNTEDFTVYVKDDTAKSLEYTPLFESVELKIEFFKGKMFWNYLIEPLVNLNYTTRILYEQQFCYIFPSYQINAKLRK